MNLEKKINTSKIVIDLIRIDESIQNPALLALLSDGWEVFSYIPVEDNGPKVILLLKQSRKADLPINLYSNNLFYTKIQSFLLICIFSYLIVSNFI